MTIIINDKEKISSDERISFRSLIAIIATTLSFFIAVTAQANTEMDILFPNGEYVEKTEDMRVTVLGGEIRLDRTWQNSRWYINPAWSNLRFIADPIDNSIKVIDRAGTLYSRSGDSNIFIFEQVFIRKTDTGWRWYDRQGNWITYDSEGRVTAYGDANDIQVRFILDEQSRRTAIHDHFNQLVFQFDYDSKERLIKATDRTGRETHYHWNGDNLVKVTDVMGNDWLYDYDKNGQLIQRTEPDGGSIKIGYNYSIKAPVPGLDSGRFSNLPTMIDGLANTKDFYKEVKTSQVGKLTDKTGAVTLWNIQYDKTKQQYTVTEDDPLGKKTVTQYNAEGKLLSRYINGNLYTKIERDGKYIEKTINERGLTTIAHYDSNRNLVKMLYPDGSSEIISYDYNINKPIRYVDAKNIITEWQYDSKGNLLRQTEAVGKLEQRELTLQYDNYGQVTTAIYGNTVKSVSTNQSYDMYGNISAFTDGEGNIHHYNYTVHGLISEYENPLGYKWQYQYDAKGNLTSTVDPLGHTTILKYDELKNLIELTDPLGKITRYQYKFDQNGRSIIQIDALGQTISNHYDINHRLIEYKLASGLTRQLTYESNDRIETIKDEFGNTTKIEYGNVENEQTGLPIAIHYPTYKETYRYNKLGFLTEIKKIINEQDDLKTYFIYNPDEQPISITKSGEQTSFYEYDAFGNLIKATDPLGNIIEQNWDSFGNLISTIDAKGNKYLFEYDLNDNLIAETQPNGDKTKFTYDTAGQLIKTTDGLGNIIIYQYDNAGRLIEENFIATNQTEPQQTVKYNYNAADRLIEITQFGLVNTHFVYSIDVIGRITQEDITYTKGNSSFTKTLKYYYNEDNKLTGLIYPDNSQVNFDYENGLIKQAKLTNNEIIHWKNYQWTEPTEIQFPGAIKTISYDNIMRPLNIKVQTDNNVLMEDSYIYDQTNNIKVRSTKNGEFLYNYDRKNRLTQVIPPQSLQQQLPIESYAYDTVDNRIGSAHQPGEWHYNSNNQLTKMGIGQQEILFEYTPTGNLHRQTKLNDVTDYYYNANNRLISVETNSNNIATYQYDPFGRRINKTVDGKTVWFLYTDEGLIAELNENGDIAVAYGWLPDSDWGSTPLWLAELDSNQTIAQAKHHYIYTDYLGTPQLAINGKGQQTWKGVAESFGITHLDKSNEITMNLRFPGQYFDDETGSHYNYFRDYQPKTGRYLQKDPIGLKGGINTYGYVSSNPIMAFDTKGLKGSLGSCTLDCLGWDTFIMGIIGIPSVIIGQPIEGSKPYVTGEGTKSAASKGTSHARGLLDKIFGGKKFKNRYPTPTGGWGTGRPLKMAYSNSAAAIAGRYIPFIGWAIIVIDVISTTACIYYCMNEPECN